MSVGPSTSTARLEVNRTSQSSSPVSPTPRDVKDAAVLVGALRALGNQLREPRSKSVGSGLFELRGMRVRIYYGFLPGRCAVLLGGCVKKREDIPPAVLRLMRARLK
jgi:hypothetical protein